MANFHHVVSFQWGPDVTEDHIDRAAAALDDLCRVVDGIVSYHHGRDAGINQGNFQYAITARFESEQHYLGYRDHPQHQAFIQTFIAGHVAQRAAVQFHG